MTRAQAEAAVWRYFHHRKPTHWTLVVWKHHTSTRENTVWRFLLEGCSVRQDRLERCGLVDENGIELEP